MLLVNEPLACEADAVRAGGSWSRSEEALTMSDKLLSQAAGGDLVAEIGTPKRIQQGLEASHDQEEALTMSDKEIVVMKSGDPADRFAGRYLQ